MHTIAKWSVLPMLLLAMAVPSDASSPTIDTIQFGNQESEEAHGLKEKLSKTVKGDLDESARVLLPPKREGWRGGTVSFKVDVDPEKTNYFTVKLWGGEVANEDNNGKRISLYIDGKQVGQRHLGAVEMLDIMSAKGQRFPGRFVYKTTVLPIEATKGKTSVELTLEAQGGINGYSGKIEQYQKPLTEPSRKIYRGYVHTDPYVDFEATEAQGTAPEFPVRPSPGPEVIKRLKDELNGLSRDLINSDRDRNFSQDDLQYMAHAYHVPWNYAYKNKKTILQIVRGLDGEYREFVEDPKLIERIQWVAKGPAGDAVNLVHEELQPYLNKPVEGTRISRRKAWTEMFVAARDWNVAHRRSYTNQSMIVDLHTYYCHLAVKRLNPRLAWPENKAVRLLHESMGLELWSGHWTKALKPTWNEGRGKLLLTEQGLTKELGYVGVYGEIVADFALMMYEATRPSPEEEGDSRLKEQLIKLTQARAPFRYQLADGDGYRAMIVESCVGWRDWDVPAKVLYDQVNGRDGGAFDIAIATGDRVLMGYAQQMVEDNQFFAALEHRMKTRFRNAKTFLLNVPENYEIIRDLPPQDVRLPMTPGQPDFVFADPTVGVVAVKNGDDILYASLYWRARYSINNLAKVHYMTPTVEREATVKVETRFKKSGHFYTDPGYTNEPFNRRHEGFYQGEGIRSAIEGQKRPIARVPKDETDYKPGKESLYAGKGDYYRLEYGPYLIAMNCTKAKSIDCEVPEQYRGGIDLVTGETIDAEKIEVGPQQTVVLYKQP